jgi:hypothetical protein
MEQQRTASSLGMWLFLATEIMFFAACSAPISFTQCPVVDLVALVKRIPDTPIARNVSAGLKQVDVTAAQPGTELRPRSSSAHRSCGRRNVIRREWN